MTTQKTRLKRMQDKYTKLSEETYKIKKLLKEANEHLRNVARKYQDSLDYARQCGEVLIKAKASVKHGNWQTYLREYFHGSRRTAQIYMQLAKNWDSNCQKEARVNRSLRNSIKAELQYQRDLKNNPQKKKKLLTEKQRKEVDKARDYLRWSFNENLRELSNYECKILRDSFDFYLWPKWYGELRNTVCQVLEYSPYEKFDPEWDQVDYHDSEKELYEIKQKVRRKVKQGLNRNRLENKK